MSPRVLAATPFPAAVAERAVKEFGATLSQDHTMTPEELLTACQKHPYEALLASSHIKFNSATIAALPASVKVLASCSVGYDHIDLAAAAKRNLLVTNTPGVLTDATADLTMLLMLAACRRATEYAAVMREGWKQKFYLPDALGTQVTGRKLGVFGFGRIGQAVAQRARGFNMEIHYHDVRRIPAAAEQGAVFHASFHDMLPHCEILTLHAPGGGGTERVLDGKAISLLPRGAIVVNSARGTLIDEDALIEALGSGHVRAAGLDVFQSEPNFDKRFLELPNVFLTPHMGSATVETRDAMGHTALDNIAAVLAGRAPPNPVTA